MWHYATGRPHEGRWPWWLTLFHRITLLSKYLPGYNTADAVLAEDPELLRRFEDIITTLIAEREHPDDG